MIWDWDLWPGVIAYGAWLFTVGEMTEQMRQLSEALTRMAREVGTALLPVMNRLAAAVAQLGL